MPETPVKPLLAAGRELVVSWDPRTSSDLPAAFFTDTLTREGLRYLRREQFPVGGSGLPRLDEVNEVVISRRYQGGTTALVRFEGGPIALVESRRASTTVEVAGASVEQVDELCDTLTDRLGAADEAEDQIPVTFWAMGQHGPTSARRRVQAPAWSEIHANYSCDTARGVGELITARVPKDGRLILWTGEPGTGKTHALRELARTWTDWCSTHFITDPETFLGQKTSYLLEVLTAADSSGERPDRDWKLIILEDSGELLAVDARERTGQALSRLLNATDGMLGQGMNALVLVTTNEPLRRLHPAIRRPGRCWSHVEFSPLSRDEANAWLAAHDRTLRVPAPATLADLYAALQGQAPETRSGFGFAA